jgi:cytochrome c5
MSSPEEHSSFIKTPLQLIVVILLAFLVPIIGILLVVELVLNQSSAEPAALKPKAVAQRLQPVGRIELVSTAPAAAGMRSGEQIVNTACGACHVAGVANAPKIGDAVAWGMLAKQGLPAMLKTVVAGKGAMPPRGGVANASDAELARAIVHMATRSGVSLKEPAAVAAKK